MYSFVLWVILKTFLGKKKKKSKCGKPHKRNVELYQLFTVSTLVNKVQVKGSTVKL